LETTFEGTKLVKSAKLQILIFRFEEIKMLEEETFGEFYSKMSDLRNSLVSLGKPVSDVKLIRKILTSLPEHFRINVSAIEEIKDLEEMKNEELVGSLQAYELSLPLVKKLKTIALKTSKKKVEASSEDDYEEEEKAMAMLAKNFKTLMRDDRFKKKFYEKMKKLNLRKQRRKMPEVRDVLSAQDLGIYELIVGTSRRAKGRHTM
jgi:hypothetical protein